MLATVTVKRKKGKETIGSQKPGQIRTPVSSLIVQQFYDSSQEGENNRKMTYTPILMVYI